MRDRQSVDERRLDEVPVLELLAGEPAPARQYLPAVTHGHRHSLFVRRHRIFVDDGTEIDVAVQRVADPDLLCLLDQQLTELGADGLIEIHAPTGGTLLALRANGRS